MLLSLAEQCKWILLTCSRMDILQVQVSVEEIELKYSDVEMSNFILIPIKNLFCSMFGNDEKSASVI
jgi:hypothetical protein